MLWSPFDLLSLLGYAATSKTARGAEQARLRTTLETLRTSLTADAKGPSEVRLVTGKFMNAASDLLCHVQMDGQSHSPELERLASKVEAVLGKLPGARLSEQEAQSLLASIAEVESQA